MDKWLTKGIDLMERGKLPDFVVVAGIRRLLRKRLNVERAAAEARRAAGKDLFGDWLTSGPIAVNTSEANEQHYEVPAKFFEEVLGPRLKYSSCIWEDGCKNLAEAEAAMLRLSCERAELHALPDGARILELGCGWGSLSLWMAEHFRGLHITAISNSASQAAFIRGRAEAKGLSNLEVVTCDINDFSPSEHFHRVVSVEMFEHCRNWLELTRRVASWLEPDGKLWVHIFTHRELAYLFEPQGESNWMARYFFTGGIMPSHDQFRRLNEAHGGPLAVEREWIVNGTHYGKTLYAWLAKQDERKLSLMPLFEEVYGADADRWFERWRVFWMACGELFNFQKGTEWQVSHYLLTKS